MRVCRYLGKFDDESTPILYPSPWNCCYRTTDLITPALTFQEAHCINDYHKCPAFLYSASIKKVPVEKKKPRKIRSRFLIFFIITFILITVLAGYYYLFQYAPSFGITLFANRASPTHPIVTLMASLTATPLSEPSPTESTPTILPPTAIGYLPTPSYTPIAKIELDMPFGSDVKFIIHKLRAGDNLVGLTEKYLTSIDAIKWVNAKLYIPLQVDALIIIPINYSTIDSQMPPFEPYVVSVYQIKVEDLALSLGVNVDQLRYFNGLNVNQILPFGYWLIIPGERK